MGRGRHPARRRAGDGRTSPARLRRVPRRPGLAARVPGRHAGPGAPARCRRRPGAFAAPARTEDDVLVAPPHRAGLAGGRADGQRGAAGRAAGAAGPRADATGVPGPGRRIYPRRRRDHPVPFRYQRRRHRPHPASERRPHQRWSHRPGRLSADGAVRRQRQRAAGPAPRAGRAAGGISGRAAMRLRLLAVLWFAVLVLSPARAADAIDGSQAARRRAAEALASRHGLQVVDSWPMPVIGVDCYVMQVKGADGAAALAALAQERQVLWAQPLQQFHGLQGADPLAPLQPAERFWHIGQLHRVSTGKGVRVALIDSAVDGGHPDLAAQLALQENFVDGAGAPPPEPHGTAVAGIIGARANNGIGIAGVAPGARLLALRACWGERAEDTRCNSFTLGKALNFAVTHQADIINLSLGGPPDPLLRALLDAARRRGMTVVAAADPQLADGGFPTSYAGVLAVGAAGATALALSAPGADIPATLPGKRWGLVSGSSYAAAQFSGLLALMLELSPGASPARLRAGLVARAGHPQLAGLGAAGAGAGSIDACATIGRLAGHCACLCSTAANDIDTSSTSAAAAARTLP